MYSKFIFVLNYSYAPGRPTRAHGHHFYGPQYRDRIAAAVGRALEMCDSAQGFFLMHSMGGGTGAYRPLAVE